ncbi:MAG TPA: uracil-DNA glycosylase family protein [Gaiellaceae bacterium]|nr:uracil-DNA glycosylase family protein [Gaiellaceae bacterium]
MTRRRTRYRSIVSLQRDNWVCRACAEAGFPLESLPIVQPYKGQHAYMFGQAPGVVEGQERRPWRGDAGRKLRRWLGLDEDEFYATFYCASVTRCYPGKDPKRGDRTPTRQEQELCALWREWEIRLIQPKLIVPVGKLAIKRLLDVDDLGCIGDSFPCRGAVAVPLPHPSGASAWPNDPANRKRIDAAVRLIHQELAKIGRNPVDR